MDPSYEEIFNHTTQFRGVLTPDGTVLAANDTILEFIGSERKGVVGAKLWDIPGIRFSESVQRQIRADVRKAANGEVVRHELTIQGTERTTLIDFSLQPLTDENGDVTHLIAGGHDLTTLQQQDTTTSETCHGQTHTDMLVTYSRDTDEPMSEAILQAFLALDIDIFDMDSTLQDWIDIDLLDSCNWQSAGPLTITTDIWEYTVDLTADDVRIYADSHL